MAQKTWGAFRLLVDTLMDELTDYDAYNRTALRKGFIAHNEHVRQTVPAHRLLDFQMQDGWEPLCKFLGKPRPDQPFPHVNEGTATADLLAKAAIMVLLIQYVLPVGGAVGALFLAWKVMK